MARGETMELVVTSNYGLMMVTREDTEMVITGGCECHAEEFGGYQGIHEVRGFYHLV